MGVEIREIRVCDLCGGPASEKVRVGWGPAFYEVDLCQAHLGEVTTLMEALSAKGRRLGERSAPRPPVMSPQPVVKPAKPRVDSATVRAWAISQGIDVSAKGRIPQAIIDRYQASGRSS